MSPLALFPRVLFFGALALVSLAGTAPASIVTFSTPLPTTFTDGPVSATATFEISADQLVVTLENLLSNPKSVGQNLSYVLFTLSGGQSSATLEASLGIPRTVTTDGTFSDGLAGPTRWHLVSAGGQMELTALGFGQPGQTIIGPPDLSGLYSAANGSIAGNGPHNPFLAQTATFTLNVPGVDAGATITAVTFGFGTTPGADTITVVPEPAALSLLALGGAALAWRKRRRR